MEKWQYKSYGLERVFKFPSFKDAIEFIDKIAVIADKMNHHPDLHLENYNRLRIVIFTHSEQKITKKDHDLASEIDSLY